MPNWISGSLKLRGPYENRKTFFKYGLNQYRYKWNEEKKEEISVLIPISEWVVSTEEYGEDNHREYVMEIDPDKRLIYIEGTKRAFLESDYICIDESYDTTAVRIIQAWDFRVEDWTDISKKYGLDVKLWGIEQCGIFMHEIEIITGEVITNESKNWENYNDFIWGCPLPWLEG